MLDREAVWVDREGWALWYSKSSNPTARLMLPISLSEFSSVTAGPRSLRTHLWHSPTRVVALVSWTANELCFLSGHQEPPIVKVKLQSYRKQKQQQLTDIKFSWTWSYAKYFLYRDLLISHRVKSSLLLQLNKLGFIRF